MGINAHAERRTISYPHNVFPDLHRVVFLQSGGEQQWLG